MNNRPEYTYGPNKNGWAVWQMTYSGEFASGDKIAWFFLKEDARKEVYRLNGWKYKENNQSNNK